jgi:hypothetical protein
VYVGVTNSPGAVFRIGIASTDVSMMWVIPTNVLLGLAGYSPGGHRCRLGSTTPPCLPIRTQIVLIVAFLLVLALIRWLTSR